VGGTGNKVGFAALNASLTHWRYQRGADDRPEWELVTFNDAGHLAVADVPEESPREAVPTPPDEER
jgi:hypothetical protein